MFVLPLSNRCEEPLFLMIQIFRFLEDGDWHSMEYLAWKARVPTGNLIDYCVTLSNLGLVEYDAQSSRVRLGRELMNIITVSKPQGGAERRWDRRGAGTVIVPPHRRLQIQGVSIQNMTEEGLRIEFTFNSRPREIVVSKV